jgi:threonine synthase
MLHPHGRTSDIQRKQMTHIEADNVTNIAIEGSFDDCQNIVKDLFNDAQFRADHSLSAVNSINWVRIIAQSVYYALAYAQLCDTNKPIRFAVPTGNFGNIYAAYVCQKMGLPIDRLIIGSNRNDILTRFFETGAMTLTNVEPSYSPSMDIQISSNFERFLFDAMQNNPDELNQFMTNFKTTGIATATPVVMDAAHKVFASYRCDDTKTLDTIKTIHDQYGYLCDPHTAVGINAALQHGIDGTIPTIALACAHPAKFPDTVQKAVGFTPDKPSILNHLDDADEYYDILPADTDTIKAFINAKI